jgi:hypothetical protein
MPVLAPVRACLCACAVAGLAFLASDAAVLQSLLMTLHRFGSVSPASSSGGAAADSLEVPLVPDAAEPSLPTCYLEPELCTGRVLCGAIVRQLRAVVLVRALLRDLPLDDLPATERALASLHLLQRMTSASALSVAWALCELDAFSAAAFRQLLASSFTSAATTSLTLSGAGGGGGGGAGLLGPSPSPPPHPSIAINGIAPPTPRAPTIRLDAFSQVTTLPAARQCAPMRMNERIPPLPAPSR